MIASRSPSTTTDAALNTACPPRRSFVAARRPPPWTSLPPTRPTIATFGIVDH